MRSPAGSPLQCTGEHSILAQLPHPVDAADSGYTVHDSEECSTKHQPLAIDLIRLCHQSGRQRGTQSCAMLVSPFVLKMGRPALALCKAEPWDQQL